MIVSRRRFAGSLSALALSTACSGRARAVAASPALGLNTWSLRELNHDQAIPVIFRVMQETGLRTCELLWSHAEPSEFDPDFASMLRGGTAPKTEQQVSAQKRRDEAHAEWRLSVPMTYFAAVRNQFAARGLTIRDYSASLNGSAAEVDRILQMAKALGATQVNSRVAEIQTDVVAAAAERQGMSVGIQVVDTRLLAQQLRASSRLVADPDIGDLTKAGIPALEFVRENLDRISSVDLKDAMTHGGSVPFGTGESKMKQVLELLKSKQSRCTAYIDCDYPGTGRSADEVKKCVRYVRGILDA
jgi:hypothetical protein